MWDAFYEKALFICFPEKGNTVKVYVGNHSSEGSDPLFGCKEIFVRNDQSRNSVWRCGLSILFPLWTSLHWQNNVIFFVENIFNLCINTEMNKWRDSQPREFICCTNALEDLLTLPI